MIRAGGEWAVKARKEGRRCAFEGGVPKKALLKADRNCASQRDRKSSKQTEQPRQSMLPEMEAC